MVLWSPVRLSQCEHLPGAHTQALCSAACVRPVFEPNKSNLQCHSLFFTFGLYCSAAAALRTPASFVSLGSASQASFKFKSLVTDVALFSPNAPECALALILDSCLGSESESSSQFLQCFHWRSLDLSFFLSSPLLLSALFCRIQSPEQGKSGKSHELFLDSNWESLSDVSHVFFTSHSLFAVHEEETKAHALAEINPFSLSLAGWCLVQ